MNDPSAVAVALRSGRPTRRALSGGRAVGCWRAAVAAPVSRAVRVLALCAWVNDLAAPPRLSRPPLLGSCLAELVDGDPAAPSEEPVRPPRARPHPAEARPPAAPTPERPRRAAAPTPDRPPMAGVDPCPPGAASTAPAQAQPRHAHRALLAALAGEVSAHPGVPSARAPAAGRPARAAGRTRRPVPGPPPLPLEAAHRRVVNRIAAAARATRAPAGDRTESTPRPGAAQLAGRPAPRALLELAAGRYRRLRLGEPPAVPSDGVEAPTSAARGPRARRTAGPPQPVLRQPGPPPGGGGGPSSAPLTDVAVGMARPSPARRPAADGTAPSAPAAVTERLGAAPRQTPAPAPMLPDPQRSTFDTGRPTTTALRPAAARDAEPADPPRPPYPVDPLDTTELTGAITRILADEARRHGIEV